MTTLPSISRTEAWVRREYGPEMAHALAVWLERAIYLCGAPRIVALLRKLVIRVSEAEAKTSGGTR